MGRSLKAQLKYADKIGAAVHLGAWAEQRAGGRQGPACNGYGLDGEEQEVALSTSLADALMEQEAVRLL